MSPTLPDMQLNVTVRVSNLANARAWYETVFGPPLYQGVDRSIDGKAVELVCFRLGGVKIWLQPLKDGQHRRREDNETNTSLALMVREPLSPLRKGLESKGIVQHDNEDLPGFPINEHGIHIGLDAEFFSIFDPDWNRIEFCYVYGQDKA